MRRLWRINPIISFADSEINDYAMTSLMQLM